MEKAIVKSARVISGSTLASRLLGFVRDILFARLFGALPAAEAFVVAFRLPNLLRDLVGEGAMNAAIVPSLSETWVKRRREFWRTCRIVVSVMGVALAAITAAGILAAPLLVRLIAPGFAADPEQLALTIRLTRWLFPYLTMVGFLALAMGILNTLEHFLVPALAPALLNLALILAMVGLCPRLSEPVYGLIVAVLVAGALQLLLHLPVLTRFGWRPGWAWEPRHASVRQIGRLMGPRLVGTSVYQLSAFVDTIFASLSWIVGPGGVAAIYYANRLLQLPLALFGFSTAQAALPALSRQAAANDREAFVRTLQFALEQVWRILIPASVGLLVLSESIVRILFQRGAFDAYATTITAYCLWLYALGLASYGGVKVLVGAFHALQDTVTPVKGATLALVINVLLNALLIWPMKIGGLALATAISSTVNAWYLATQLRARMGPLGGRAIARAFASRLVAALVMGGIVWVLQRWWLDGAGGEREAAGLLAIIALGIGAYFLSLPCCTRLTDLFSIQSETCSRSKARCGSSSK